MKTVLSHILFPKAEEPSTRLLYIRDNGKVVIQNGKMFLSENETVSLDTYFNAFFYSKYLSHTGIQTVDLILRFSGNCTVKLLISDAEGRITCLDQKMASGQNAFLKFRDVNLATLPIGGMLFFQIMGGVGGTILYEAVWETDCNKNEISLAIVICTYKREKYVRHNIELIKRAMLQITNKVELFVIDNGRTLDRIEGKKIHIIPNRNCGGSGGFTRGLMEACAKGFSHVLFMDDDIYFEPETIFRTVQILKVAKIKNKPMMIGGAMLIENEPTIQFESGAFYKKGKLRPIGQGLDLSKVASLLENDKEYYVQYNAWWYCCFPTNVVNEIGLPLPFFIKSDDVEYGLRANADIVLLNGIGVWHMAFSKKYTPYLEYYIKRNELVVDVIHKSGNGIFQSVWKLVRGSGKACLMRNIDILNYLILAYRDFLKGPEFFINLDAEAYNADLRKKVERKKTSATVLRSMLQVVCVGGRLILNYRKVKKEYMARWRELTTYEYWYRQLGYEIDRGNSNA